MRILIVLGICLSLTMSFSSCEKEETIVVIEENQKERDDALLQTYKHKRELSSDLEK